MRANVSIETLRNDSGEFLLVNVSNSEGLIGICDTSVSYGKSRKTFYIGGESLINMSYRAGDDEANRQIWQCSSIDKCKSLTGSRFSSVCDSFFNNSVPLSKALGPVLDMLTDGLYVVHVSQLYPSDGAGNFFWNAYGVKHEFNGSAPINRIIGSARNYTPSFIVPTEGFMGYSESALDPIAEKIKSGGKAYGLAYHLSGMFSALLYGHLNATASLYCDVPFECIVIEPVTEILYGYDEISSQERIAALACPYAKLPFDLLSRQSTESFFSIRRSAKPRFFDEIMSKVDKMPKSGNYIRGLSNVITSAVERLPDADMLISSCVIDDLTDEEIQVLLSGETSIDDRVIISNNYYESIVCACNYLQLKDKKRFITFAEAILANHELSATHQYVAGRLKYIMDASINELFKKIYESEEPVYDSLKPIAEKYAQDYAEYNESSVKSFLSSGKSRPSLSAPASGEKRYASASMIEDAIEDARYSSLALSKQVGSSSPK